MINKDVLTKYVRIITGCDADPNLTLVDFSLNDEQRNIVNLVNEEAKKDKKLAELLDDLKYSNNKMSVIDAYFDEKEVNVSVNCKKEKIDNYGFINLSNLGLIVGFVTFTLAVVITVWA